MQTNTQLTKYISQFTQQLKNETMAKWIATMNAFINQKQLDNNYNEVQWLNSHKKFESTRGNSN